MIDKQQHESLVGDVQNAWHTKRAAQVATYASLPKMDYICWVPKRGKWKVSYKGKQDFTSLTPEGAQDVLKTFKIRHIQRQIKQLKLELETLKEHPQ